MPLQSTIWSTLVVKFKNYYKKARKELEVKTIMYVSTLNNTCNPSEIDHNNSI